MFRTIRPSRGLATGLMVGVLIGVIVGGSIAYASIPDASGVYTACRKTTGAKPGALRISDPSAPSSSLASHCAKNEAQLQWNATGPPGTPGVSGYEVDSANASSATAGKAVGQMMIAALACPTGKKVLSGGAAGDWGPTGPVGAPTSGGTVWTVTGTVTASSFNGLSIWAICAIV
jgi:hypothetical protein